MAEELALIDVKTDKARGEALDIAHAAPLLPAARFVGGGYEMLGGADLVVMTAGANQRPGETRRDILSRNLAVTRAAAEEIIRLSLIHI